MINKNKEVKRYHSNKPKPFQANWSITTTMPQYDALEDPHASCYFLNKSVRKHLTTLKKSIAYQGSFVQKKKIRYLIGERIKDYDSIITNKNKLAVYTFNNLKQNSSIKSLSPHQNPQNNLENSQEKHKKQKKQNLIKQFKTIDVVNQKARKQQKNVNLPKIINKQKLEAETINIIEKQQSSLDIKNKTKHQQFIEFIEKRKKKLRSQISIKNINKTEKANGQKVKRK